MKECDSSGRSLRATCLWNRDRSPDRQNEQDKATRSRIEDAGKSGGKFPQT